MAQSGSVVFGNWGMGNRREGTWRGRRRLGNDQTGTLESTFYRRGHSEQWRDLRLPPPGYSSWFVVFSGHAGRRRWKRGAGCLWFWSLLTPHSHDMCLGIPLWCDPFNSANLCTLLFPNVGCKLSFCIVPQSFCSQQDSLEFCTSVLPHSLILFQLEPLRWMEASYLLGAPRGDHIHALLHHLEVQAASTIALLTCQPRATQAPLLLSVLPISTLPPLEVTYSRHLGFGLEEMMPVIF